MRLSTVCSACFLAGFALTGIATPALALIVQPPLDETEYASLRTNVLARIDAYAPGWTDYSDSDPGVTLLELFAFTAEDLAYRVALDVPHELLWGHFDASTEPTLGSVAYVLADAAWLSRYGDDVRAQDWLMREGIDPAWTYAELRSAAMRARTVPEPATIVLLAAGLLLLLGTATARSLRRICTPSRVQQNRCRRLRSTARIRHRARGG